MTVRAKFRVTETTTSASNYGTGPAVESSRVKLSAVSDDLNKGWSKWTPSGEITLHINNPAAFEQFKPGVCYFVDFAEAPAKEADEKPAG